MNERDDKNLSAEESISDEISERVRSVISAAESAATAIRHEAEQQAQIQRRAAEAEGQRFLEKAKAEADALLQERRKRISELSDSLIQGTDALLMRIDGAQEVKRQLETMVHALAEAAETLAAEGASAAPAPGRAAPEPAAPEPVPVPDEEPELTEADAPAASRAQGPAQPSDLEPVEVEPADDDDDVEVVDAVAVVDEPEPERRSPVERLRKAAGRDGNGAADEPKQAEPRGFEGDDMLAARLVALQMAVAGSARVEVEEHLRKTFSMDDPGAILTDVFGSESKL